MRFVNYYKGKWVKRNIGQINGQIKDYMGEYGGGVRR